MMTPIQIVATIGPKSNDEAIMHAMVRAGMSLARLNFSWGTYDEHRDFIQKVRRVGQALQKRVPIIQDLSGPRIQQGSGHTFSSDIPVLTDKDKADIAAMASEHVEYVALSFVKDAEDVAELRQVLVEHNVDARIIAKIERQEALDNLDGIIAASDGIMVARGDLGEALPVERVPIVKKDILARCVEAGKPAIVATEMLTSMQHDPDPSRADVSDIASAVFDGASATMLSNETAVGEFPVAAVALMRRVVDEALEHYAAAHNYRF